MAKVSKRESMLKSETLAQRLKEAEEDEPQSVYKPVRNSNSDFLAAVDNAIAKEDPSSQPKSGGDVPYIVFVCLIMLALLAISVWGFIFAKWSS